MYELAPVLEACLHGERDDTFLYDMCKRADMRWDNTQLHGLDPCAPKPSHFRSSETSEAVQYRSKGSPVL